MYSISNKPIKRDWTCNCGELNYYPRDKCYKCKITKSKSVENLSELAVWNCTNCNDLNFASREFCRKCNIAKNVNPALNIPIVRTTELLLGKCKICFDRNLSVRLPCGHIVMCDVCFYLVCKCPICQSEYKHHDMLKI